MSLIPRAVYLNVKVTSSFQNLADCLVSLPPTSNMTHVTSIWGQAFAVMHLSSLHERCCAICIYNSNRH